MPQFEPIVLDIFPHPVPLLVLLLPEPLRHKGPGVDRHVPGCEPVQLRVLQRGGEDWGGASLSIFEEHLPCVPIPSYVVHHGLTPMLELGNVAVEFETVDCALFVLIL